MATGRRRTREADTRRSSTPRGQSTERFTPEASKEQLVKIDGTSVPNEVTQSRPFEATVRAKNDATVIFPGDPDRCGGSAGEPVGYKVRIGWRKDGAVIGSEDVCLPASGGTESVTVTIAGPGATGTNTYEAFVQTLPRNSNRPLASEDVPVNVVPRDGGGDPDDPNNDDPYNDDPNNDDPNNDDPYNDDPNNDDPDDEDSENAGVVAWFRGLETGEQIALGAGVGALALLGGRRTRRQR